MTIEIRDAQADDEGEWRRLWADYLAFYQVKLADDITNHTWARILDPTSRLSMRVAIEEGEMAGFAIHHHHDSTWARTPDCYLEDLYLDQRFRGRGIGRLLLDDLIKIARSNQWSRLYWHTNRDNRPARKLYDSYVQEDGHVRYRMSLNR